MQLRTTPQGRENAFPRGHQLSETPDGVKKFRLADYDIDVWVGELIGQGSFGTVHRAQYKSQNDVDGDAVDADATGKRYQKIIVKRMTFMGNLEEDLDEWLIHSTIFCAQRGSVGLGLRRKAFMHRVPTPFIPKVLFAMQDNMRNRFVFMQKMEIDLLTYFGMVDNAVDQNSMSKTDAKKLKIDVLLQIAILLSELQSKFYFMHRDMHMYNIMVSSSSLASTPRAGLIDFGYSKMQADRKYGRYVFLGKNSNFADSVSNEWSKSMDLTILCLHMISKKAQKHVPIINNIMKPLRQELTKPMDQVDKLYLRMAEFYQWHGGLEARWHMTGETSLHALAYGFNGGAWPIYRPCTPKNFMKTLLISRQGNDTTRPMPDPEVMDDYVPGWPRENFDLNVDEDEDDDD